MRTPGGWARLLDSLEQTPAATFLAGALATGLGAAMYLSSPWQFSAHGRDWLSIAISIIGGIAVAKGLFFIAAPERITGLGRKLMTGKSGLLAGITAVLGAALVFTALSRLQTI